jgi:hypothetical protein
MTSFPRSGNSFLRKFLEQITGIYTGSDGNIKMGVMLQHTGLLGENHFGDDTVWITKAHYPYMQAHAPWTADKIICIVRNPIDVIPSYMSLAFLLSHTAVPVNPWNTVTAWPDISRYFLGGWNEYHLRVREMAKNTPTFFLTYE